MIQSHTLSSKNALFREIPYVYPLILHFKFICCHKWMNTEDMILTCLMKSFDVSRHMPSIITWITQRCRYCQESNLYSEWIRWEKCNFFKWPQFYFWVFQSALLGVNMISWKFCWKKWPEPTGWVCRTLEFSVLIKIPSYMLFQAIFVYDREHAYGTF